MIVIPAIDLRHGETVRLRQGRADEEKVFQLSPAEAARRWRNLGARYLHVVDLDGAFAGEPRNLASLASIMEAVDIPVQFGGGMRSEKTLSQVLGMGVERVIVGTRALQSLDWLKEMCARFPGRVALGLDVRAGKLVVKGWQELHPRPLEQLLADISELPLSAVIFTSVLRDGMLEGPDIKEIEEISRICPIPLIASGGITTLEDVLKLKALPLAGIIIGRALYEGSLRLDEAIAVAK